MRPGGPCRRSERRNWSGVRHYVGARLHRRLFVIMGLAIFVVFFAVGAVMHATRSVGPDGRFTAPDPVLGGIKTYFAGQFAEVWDSPKKTQDLIRRTSEAFQVGLHLRDVNGVSRADFGEVCPDTSWHFPIVDHGVTLGRLEICPTGRLQMGSSRLFLALGTAALVLWIVAGLLARMLSRPLVHLSRITKEIGEGHLSSRVQLDSRGPGEVGDLAHAINDMAERIEHQLKGQRELLAGVSHEIRTPLARLRVLTEILRDQNVHEKSLVAIEREIVELDDLTGQLLASSRLEFESLSKLELDPIEIAKESLLRTNFDERLLQTKGSPKLVSGDATLLARAIVNLLENARSHGGGLDAFLLHFSDDEVSFSARDTGPGFAQADLPHAFDSFYRGTGSGKGTSSLGLGLALVQRIAAAHQGKAFAFNRDKGGAEVGFTIPLRGTPRKEAQ